MASAQVSCRAAASLERSRQHSFDSLVHGRLVLTLDVQQPCSVLT